MGHRYVHGHHRQAQQRLRDQANALVELLHHDTTYPPGSRVLEAGCGVGAQTITLARRSPAASIVAVDRSEEALATARRAARRARLTNVEFQRADLLNLPFPARTFDHLFVCFVLEHLVRPGLALRRLAALVKPGGTVTVIEGDHRSAYFHPDSPAAQAAIDCLVELQHRAGGNGNLGRQVHPLMIAAGLRDVRVSPRMVYVDRTRPDLAESFTKKTFTAMVADVRPAAVAARLTTGRRFDDGIRALRRTARRDGVFCYTFFKGVGVAPAPSRAR
jgi:ubiquinone/menaquinone biosynthesis C-methylase UbiE